MSPYTVLIPGLRIHKPWPKASRNIPQVEINQTSVVLSGPLLGSQSQEKVFCLTYVMIQMMLSPSLPGPFSSLSSELLRKPHSQESAG